MPESFQNADLTQYDLRRYYARSEGLRQIPVAGKTDGTQECAFVREHSPIESMVITWSIVSEGSPMPAPDPLSFEGDQNLVFLSSELGGTIPTPMGDGMHSWLTWGKLVFGLKVPRKINGDLPLGKCFWEKGTPEQNTIPGSFFKKGILAVVPPATGGVQPNVGKFS